MKRLYYLDTLKVMLTVLVVFVLLAVQHATDGLALSGMVKLQIIGLVASALSFSITYLLRLIPGVKQVL